jgi:hypothetical protein
MSLEVEMKKVDQLSSGRDIMAITKNGRLSISTKLRKSKIRDSMKTSVSILEDHSISDLECQ